VEDNKETKGSLSGTKSAVKAKRDGLQQLIYAIINPAVRAMIKMGFTPNIVTTIGFIGNLAAAPVL